MKIYTRTGDQGQTDLHSGRRVAKDALQMEVCGTLDELNSLLGVTRAETLPDAIDAVLHRVQSELFTLGAELSGADHKRRDASALSDENVLRLEADIDRFDADLRPLAAFILPGGTRAAAVLHLARAVSRRAERRLVSLLEKESEAVRPVALAYLNRLSDLLFVLARAANARAGADEQTWPEPTKDP